jgi:S1-C subfamily serine protease
MRFTGRARRAGMAAAVAVVVGGGVALGATLEGPLKPGGLPASTAGAASPASHADVVRQVLPSVVLIRTPSGFSSGVVLDRSGHILTTAHAVGNATALHVQAAGDPAPRTAHLVGSYPPEDLAVIRADDPYGLQPVWFGDSDKAQAGEVVLAVSNGAGLSGSVPEGIISATGRVVTDPVTRGGDATILREAIQSSVAISPGNSGGALVNTSGQVIGIPTLAARPQDGPYAEGIGFAIPSNLARNTASKIIASAHVTNTLRATFGAQTAAFTGASPGGSAPNWPTWLTRRRSRLCGVARRSSPLGDFDRPGIVSCWACGMPRLSCCRTSVARWPSTRRDMRLRRRCVKPPTRWRR